MSEPARETTEERRKTGGATESEPVRAVETIEAEESDSGLDGHGWREKKTRAASEPESGSESCGGLDGLCPEKKKTGGARASESGSGSGFCGRALQQRRCPGESR